MFDDLSDVKNFALGMIKKFKLKGVKFKFNGLYTRTFGSYEEATKTIELSTKLTVANLSNKPLIECIILHEIAHAIDHKKRGVTFHDKIWKKEFVAIGGDGVSHFNVNFKVNFKVKKQALIENKIILEILKDVPDGNK